MSATRVFIVAILAAVAGAFMALGLNTLTQREAIAQSLPDVPTTGTDPMVAAKTGNSTVGPGGSFVTDVYKKASPAVVHITNRSVGYDFFMGPVSNESTGSGVIVDKNGKVAYVKVQEIKVAREDKEILAALAKLS